MLLISLTIGLLLPSARADQPGTERIARQILQQSGVKGGLIVHVGCGDGQLTAALGLGESYVVHGLLTEGDGDASTLANLRNRLQSSADYGKIAVARWTGGPLPYVDNLVNLLVITGGPRPSERELRRVLAPNGVAMIRHDEGWSKLVEPWPSEIDEWTHYLHDATNNAVADDTLVGPPKHFQWIGAPRWLRHHDHMSGLSAMVSSQGRLFAIIDMGPRWSVQMPPKWTLVARDAFSGTILWQRPIARWHAHLWPLKKGPARLMRRLVAQRDRLFVTLGVGEPVSVLDAATGETLQTLDGTQGAEEIILSEGRLYAVVNPEGDAYADLPRDSVRELRLAGAKWNWNQRPRRLVAIDTASGKRLWTRTNTIAPTTLASDGSKVYLHDGDKMVCLEGGSGESVWKSKPIARWNPLHVLFGPTLVVYRDVVLFAGGENLDPHRGGDDTMTAVSAETGEVLWTAPHPRSGYASSEDLLVINGLVWCGETNSPGQSGTFTGRDPKTGEVKVEFPADDWRHMPHHRCYRAKATCDYILASRTGIEFVDLRKKHWTAHHWVRGSCNYGILPANGLVYAPPHSCACYPVAKLNALNALASAAARLPATGEGKAEEPSDRLETGPAYDASAESATASSQGETGAKERVGAHCWPTYRGDAARSGSTEASVPVELSRLWKVDLGGRLTSPVIADGRVFVASVDRHQLHALNAGSGEPTWTFTAGGRIDSPPTLWRDRVLFGCADGYVYCLRADNGVLAWRYRAGPHDQRMMAMDQVESVWPLHGSVLVHDGTVYCVAGRSMWLDGGLRFLRLDARRGELLSETILDDTYPESGENLQTDLQWPNLPAALPDVLSFDGRYVYMRSQPFDLKGNRTEVLTPRNYDQQRGETAHLFSPTGFLDDSWWHRSYWMFGRQFIGGAGGWYLAAFQAPAGRILAVDGEKIYGFGRLPLRFTGSPNKYHLFACDKQPPLIVPNVKPRKRGARIYGEVLPSRLQYDWSESLPLLVRAMVSTRDAVFVAGPPAVVDEDEVYNVYSDPRVQQQMEEQVAAFEGQRGAIVMAVAKADGRKLAAYRTESIPVFDGMAAADGRLFFSGADGTLHALGTGTGKPLDVAEDIRPGPVDPSRSPFYPTKKHPDFQFLESIRVGQSDLGYRLQSPGRTAGIAAQKLEQPLSGRVTLRVRVRATPGAPSPDTPGNGFVVFGHEPTDKPSIKCGFRISGRSLSIIEGSLFGGATETVRFEPKADAVAEIEVVVDLNTQTVRATMLGESVEAKLQEPLKSISWVGYCVAGVVTDFGPLEIEQE